MPHHFGLFATLLKTDMNDKCARKIVRVYSTIYRVIPGYNSFSAASVNLSAN